MISEDLREAIEGPKLRDSLLEMMQANKHYLEQINWLQKNNTELVEMFRKVKQLVREIDKLMLLCNACLNEGTITIALYRCFDACGDGYLTCEEHKKIGGMDGDEEPIALKLPPLIVQLKNTLGI